MSDEEEDLPTVGGHQRSHNALAAILAELPKLSAYALRTLRTKLDETLSAVELAEAAAARRAAELESARRTPCASAHAHTRRGLDVPAHRGGSWRTEVCVDCGAFRTHGHLEDKEPIGLWRPASEYEAAVKEDD